MSHFEAKEYQQQALDSVTNYFNACHEQNPSMAFYSMTGVAYRALKGFHEEMPYFCLRVPTGGGKTWIGAKSVALINKQFLRETEHSVILWLVPSNQIREQTLKGFRNVEHPLYSALLEAGAMTVLSLDEAKSVTPATLNTSTVIIVATRQAFQVKNEDDRKVYESNGALMGHFDNLVSEQLCEVQEDRAIIYSLANALKLRRPFVIVDEAHNNRTELGFDTLAKFNPSGIMELTATPDEKKTPSNVLHSVSAVELKSEQMIKLPIILDIKSDPQECLNYAITQREVLQKLADKEHKEGASYLRPIILIQAEAKRTDISIDVQKVKQALLEHHNANENEIVIATGDEKGLDALSKYPLGIMDKNCPVKFVITQQALAEGWDCPFAYVLVSMANVHSSTAVEQLLGRILRQPNATRRQTPELNQSYAFVVSRNFSETASALRDSLVQGTGFERKAVSDFVKPRDPNQFDIGKYEERKIKPIEILLTEKPTLTELSKPLKAKVKWDDKKKILTINSPLTPEDAEDLKKTVQCVDAKIHIENAAQESRLAIEHFKTPAERGIRFRISQLAVYIQGELQLFDDPTSLPYIWNLLDDDAKPLNTDIQKIKTALDSTGSGAIDTTQEGKMTIAFMPTLQRSLELIYTPEHWDNAKLAVWLCRNIENKTITHANKQAFVMGYLQSLLEQFTLAQINQQKFLIRNLLEQHINALHKDAMTAAYQETLFSSESKNVLFNDNYYFEFHPQIYSPTKYYDANTSKYGHYSFEHHYYGQIGDFDSKEEFECACRLDQLATKQKVQFWVRNLVSTRSFFLQKSNGRFHPDFICVLPDESILIVEYKGADRWNAAEDDREIGQLWASLSNGKCEFIMINKKDWHLIDTVVEKHDLAEG
jgi:type III restriction enzyme